MNRVRQADLGTPAIAGHQNRPRSRSTACEATVRAGTSILRAARECGVDIPEALRDRQR